jgi:hypothetical protein
VTLRRRITRRALDSWFPTLARYFGLALLAYAALVDKGRNPALYPAAMGLVFLKTVLGNGNGK